MASLRAHTDWVTMIATLIDNSDMIVTASRDKFHWPKRRRSTVSPTATSPATSTTSRTSSSPSTASLLSSVPGTASSASGTSQPVLSCFAHLSLSTVLSTRSLSLS
ncbi:Guanine nucleotide-binding protein subunit beta-like protein [Camellia lanceoleosa]|nr:Guanine nucleotide-binding protein subunit beta-like protein [Camellia lanceoleosa]